MLATVESWYYGNACSLYYSYMFKFFTNKKIGIKNAIWKKIKYFYIK